MILLSFGACSGTVERGSLMDAVTKWQERAVLW